MNVRRVAGSVTWSGRSPAELDQALYHWGRLSALLALEVRCHLAALDITFVRDLHEDLQVFAVLYLVEQAELSFRALSQSSPCLTRFGIVQALLVFSLHGHL